MQREKSYIPPPNLLEEGLVKNIIRDGYKPAHEVKLVANFGLFVVYKGKFMAGQLVSTFHKCSSCWLRFVPVCEQIHLQTDCVHSM